jgi:hypothetical protein
MSRFTNALILILALAIAGVMQAQTCTPPVIIQVGGTNPLCAGQPVMLDAGSGWTTYQWSPGGATTRMISDTPNATMSYTVTTTDANGCTVTSQPLTVVVNSAAYAPPAIQGAPSDICPSGNGTALIDTPSPDYATITWTVQNGTITAGASGHNVSFQADSSGLPLVAAVAVADANGCPAQSSVTIPIRTIPTPAVHTFEADVCPAGIGQVYVDGPASGNWKAIYWTIEHGSLPYGNTSQSAVFTADGSGLPVVLYVTVGDFGECTAQNSITIPIRTIPTPVVHTFEADVCPTGLGQVYVDGPASGNSWKAIHWTIEHGSLPYGNTSQSAVFTGDGSGLPVVLHVTVGDFGECTTQNSITIPIRTISTPVVHTFEADVCPTGIGQVYVDGPASGNSWKSIYWTIEHGSLPYGNTSQSAVFTADGSGLPVVLHVTVGDFGECQAQNSITIPIRTIPTPVVHTFEPDVSPTGNGQVYVDGPASGNNWKSIYWTIEHGSLPYGNTSQSAVFTADGSGLPVVLHVTVSDFGECQAQNSITIPVRANATGTIHTDQSTVCINGYGAATIDDAPPENPWTSINWAVENGTVVYGQGTTRVNFQADGSGNAVVVHVWAQNASGAVQSSVTLPTRIPAPPVIALGAGSCPATAWVTNPSDYTQFMWSANNAEITSSLYGASVTFHAQQNGHVTLTVVARDSGGCESTASIGYDASGLPDITMSLPGVPYCYGVPATASVPDGGPGVTYQWSLNSGQFLGSSTTLGITFIPQADTLALSVTATNAQGCSAGGTAYILVNRAPVGDFNSVPASVCANGAATISTYTNGVSYNWQVIDGDIVSGAGTSAITFRAHTGPTVTVRLTKTGQYGCGATYERIIPVTAVDTTVTSSGPTTFCAGGSVTLTAASGTSYLWSTGATTRSIAVSAAGSYSVTVTGAGGCSATSAPSVVTVSTPIATITSSGPTTFCSGGSVTLTANSGASYLWSNGATTRAITVAQAADYVVTVYDANGCSLSSAPAHVTTLIPVTPNISASLASICPNGASRLTVTNASSFASITWILTNGLQVENAADQSWILVQLPYYASGDVTATMHATDLATGCQVAASITLPDVRPTPPPITITGGTGCSGDRLTASIPTQPPGTLIYWWALDGAQLVSGGNGTTSAVIYAAGNDFRVKVEILTPQFCSAETVITVPSHAAPAPVLTSSDVGGYACAFSEQTVTLTNASVYTSIAWTVTNGTIVGPSDQPTVRIRLLDDGYTAGISVRVSDNGTCFTAAYKTITSLGPAVAISGGTGSYCAGSTVNLAATAAASGSTFLWSNGATSNVIGVTVPGTYTVTVTNSIGCSRTSAPVTVAFYQAVEQVQVSGPTTFCAGGSVTLTAYDGPGNVYEWSNGATTRSIAVSETGDYRVTVTGPNICRSISDPVHVTVNSAPVPAISANGPTTFCAGGNVTLTASSGASYLWSNGATTQSITVSAIGNYSVTVTNANGCSATSSPTLVTVNPNPTASITAGGPTTFCAGGSVTLTASSAASYLWSNGATTQLITPSASGNYTVTVTNANGCSATSSPTAVTVNANPTASINAGGPTTFCAGGSVTLTASSGASYLWSTGATTQTISASASGNYSVTVTNASGCSVTTSPTVVTVNPNPTASITAGGPTTFCAGGSVTLTASSGASYLWSTGATTQAVTVTASGSYSVTVTNANGCSATSSPTVVTVNPNPTASITAGGPTTFCAGGSVTLTATSGASYLWSTGATTQAVTVTASGSYSVTVTNANGCSATSSPTVVTVKPNPTASITAVGPTTFCAGGSVTLTAASGSSYLWSTGATTQSISASAGGNYSVTVTNANGCSATSSPTVVTVNANPTASITAGGPTTFCAGGSVTLTASSGTSYLWSTGATTQAITASASGNYTVTVTNANECSATSAPTVVTVNPNPTASITAGGPTTFCEGGSVTLTASSGSSYLWSTGATTQSIAASTSGGYSVTVTSASGCSVTSTPTTVTVNANPAAPVITADGPTTFCAGGSVTLTAPASPAYLWSNGATTQSIVASTSGNYSVTVTNANGCGSTSVPMSVTVNALPTPSIAVEGPLTYCQSFSSTILNASPQTGTWYRNGVAVGTTARIFVRDFGTGTSSFVWRATNASGCVKDSDAVVVTVNPAPDNRAAFGSLCLNGTSDAESLETAPGTTYLWSITNGTIVSGQGTRKIIYAADANATSVGIDWTVTSAAGCPTMPANLHFDVTADPMPTSISASGPTTFCPGGSVVLTAAAVPGAAYYQWSNGSRFQSITVTAGGTYSVHAVKAANGCAGMESAPVSVTVQPAPTATITAGGPTTFCAGGSVTLTASSGSSYLWSTGATTQAITASASGSFSVTVTNASGCSAASAPTTVTVNANPTASITAGGPTTFCAGGSVTLTASSGASYLWSTGATTQAIVASASGNYSVTVTNANGCSATSSPTIVTVNPNPTASITAGGPTTFCAGGSVTLTASSGASYLWSTGATTQAITVNASGNYSVTVTNANGCSATSSPTVVTVNANPTASISAGGPTTFCAGGSVTLTASSGASYLWSTGATTQSIGASASGNYSVTVTNASGCSATSATKVVTVNANPTASITAGGPTTFCAGGSVTLTASSGTSYLWSTGATTQAITASTSGNYTVTVTNANGCSATSAPKVVTANANPAASITAGGPTTFCAGGSVTLTASSGASYLWSTGATTQAITVNASGSYNVTVTNASGCSAGAAPVAVTVKTLPTAAVSGGGTICPGGSATITAALTGTAPWSVTWSDNVTQTINSGSTATRSVSPSATTTYTVTTVSDAASCPRAGTGSATVTRNVPASIATQPSNQTTTRNTNVTLTVVAAGTSPISYQWFNGNGTVVAGATSASYTTSFSKKGTNTFYVEVWNSCNATHVRSNTVTITVN